MLKLAEVETHGEELDGLAPGHAEVAIMASVVSKVPNRLVPSFNVDPRIHQGKYQGEHAKDVKADHGLLFPDTLVEVLYVVGCEGEQKEG